MKIEGVVVSCYVRDFYLTRLCVASLRYWYPDLPIWLLKDVHAGDFDTREIESHWGVQIYPTKRRSLGWGFGKLELMTELPARRLLLLDSDIVIVGRVIDRLEKLDADLVVNEERYDAAGIETNFFPLEKLRKLDPEFAHPGWAFNTGQLVVTTGSIRKADVGDLVDWEARKVRDPDLFRKGEQGVSNYVVQKRLQRGELSVHRERFMFWPGTPEAVAHIRVADLTPEGKHQELIHWAGFGWGQGIFGMPRSDILRHFEDLYYSRIPGGQLRRSVRALRSRLGRVRRSHPMQALRRLRDRVLA
jgi:hypothetical protein